MTNKTHELPSTLEHLAGWRERATSSTVTVERCYNSCSERAESLWVHHQEGSLQAVCEGNPGQVPKHQHEAKTIVHDVHGC